nr:MAG TPA: protein of unknown function DUF859 [Caudoviricetes sp.]
MAVFTSKSYEGRYLQLTITESVNVVENTSTLTWVLQSLGGSVNYYTTGPTTVTINGTQVYYKARTAWSTSQFPAAKGSTSGTITVAHDSNGSKSISVGFSTAIYTSTVTEHGGTMVLSNIDRAAPSVSVNVSSITANSIKITVSSSATANKWWYSLNGGSSWVAFNSSSGASKETTVTGLSPNTSYTVQACARKSYNGVDGYSGKTTVKTLGGSVLSSVSTLTADNATVKITLSATVYDTSYKHKLVLKDGGTTVLTLTELSLSNGSNTITLTASQRSSILADMATKKSFTGTFELSTFSGSSQIGSTSTKTATVQTTAANSAPTFSGFTYKDTNTTAAGVTGNNQILIQSVSTLQVTASAATAKNGATISSYSVSAGGSTASSTTVTLNVGKIYTSGTVPIIVTAIDSRGYTSSATVNITVIAYESIDITTAIMRRVNEVEDVTQVTLEGDITPVKVNNVNKNTLRKLYYQYKRTDASAYSSFTDITSFATFNDSGFTFTSDEWLSLDANYSWYVRFYVYDNLTDDTATITVSQGTPLISFRRKKVGINKREPTQALDVDGNIAANGVIVLGYVGHVEGDFNNYKNGGIFFAPTTSGISNAPPGGAGYLEVLSTTDGFNLIQRYTATAAGCKVYIRSFILNTNWTPWTEK